MVSRIVKLESVRSIWLGYYFLAYLLYASVVDSNSFYSAQLNTHGFVLSLWFLVHISESNIGRKIIPNSANIVYCSLLITSISTAVIDIFALYVCVSQRPPTLSVGDINGRGQYTTFLLIATFTITLLSFGFSAIVFSVNGTNKLDKSTQKSGLIDAVRLSRLLWNVLLLIYWKTAADIIFHVCNDIAWVIYSIFNGKQKGGKTAESAPRLAILGIPTTVVGIPTADSAKKFAKKWYVAVFANFVFQAFVLLLSVAAEMDWKNDINVFLSILCLLSVFFDSTGLPCTEREEGWVASSIADAGNRARLAAALKFVNKEQYTPSVVRAVQMFEKTIPYSIRVAVFPKRKGRIELDQPYIDSTPIADSHNTMRKRTNTGIPMRF